MSTMGRSTAREQGMVSILVTMLLLIVVSLIVLGFAQISRRNQRQTLDRQLSTQAFYAAETGVNDVRDIIRQNINAGTSVVAKSTCDPASVPAYAPPILTPTIDAAANVSYTCILVDPAPSALHYTASMGKSTIVPLITVSGTIANITLSWQSLDSATPATGCPVTTSAVFSNMASWTCGYGVMRVDAVNSSGSLSLASLPGVTMTSFLVPQNGVGTNSVGFVGGVANTNNRLGVKCDDSGCSLKITGLSSSQYYLRVSSIYKEGVPFQVVATDASGNPLKIQGAQAVIDSTGKAQDVLRRIQVYVPLTPSSNNQLPDYAVQSTDPICKRFVTMDGFFQSYAKAVVSSLTSLTSPTNPLCE